VRSVAPVAGSNSQITPIPDGIDLSSEADSHPRTTIDACAGALLQQCDMGIIGVVVRRDGRRGIVIF
jgi:hypothetical protein